jgi:hypothetical protein
VLKSAALALALFVALLPRLSSPARAMETGASGQILFETRADRESRLHLKPASRATGRILFKTGRNEDDDFRLTWSPSGRHYLLAVQREFWAEGSHVFYGAHLYIGRPQDPKPSFVRKIDRDVWSPRWAAPRRIGFVSNFGSYGFMNPRGHIIAEDEVGYPEQYPRSFSPNGRYLFYEDLPYCHHWDQDCTPPPDTVRIRDLVDGGSTVIGEGRWSDGEWSPDGTMVVYGSGTVYSLAMGESWQAASGSGASWSPDSSHLTYAAGGDIYTVDVDGDDVTQLTSGAVHDDEPRWSPHGGTILFRRTRDANTVDERSDLFVVAADGHTPPLRVTFTPRRPEKDLSWRPIATP